MNKGAKAVLWLGGGTLAFFGIKKLVNLSSTSNAIQLKIAALKIKGTKLYFDIQIFNPTRGTIKIDSIAGDVFFNKKSIGVIQYFNQVPIAPLSYSKFKDVLVELTPGGIVTLLTKVITKAAATGEFSLEGKTYIKGVGVPFKETVKAW